MGRIVEIRLKHDMQAKRVTLVSVEGTTSRPRLGIGPITCVVRYLREKEINMENRHLLIRKVVSNE